MLRFSREFLALIQLSVVIVAVTFLSACGNGGSSATSESAGACAPLPPAANSDFLVHLTPFMNHLCYQKQNWQHDAQVRTSDGVHPYVRVWYSPSLFDWITVKNRTGPVPDGAMVVKEQFHSPECHSDAVAGRRMRRAAGLFQRRGIVLPQLSRVGDRQFGNLLEHRVPESTERQRARGCVGDDR
jgi:hypothetical protein